MTINEVCREAVFPEKVVAFGGIRRLASTEYAKHEHVLEYRIFTDKRPKGLSRTMLWVELPLPYILYFCLRFKKSCQVLADQYYPKRSLFPDQTKMFTKTGKMSLLGFCCCCFR